MVGAVEVDVMYDAMLERHGWSASPEALERAAAHREVLDACLQLALELAGQGGEHLEEWREPIYREAQRQLFPRRFQKGPEAVCETSRYFFPLAATALRQTEEPEPTSLSARLPFAPLREEEIQPWPSGEEYVRLMGHLEREHFSTILAMAQRWKKLSIQDHILGVTGLSLWMGRQLAQVTPVDLPLLHGGAIGHDVGKFGCVGDEAKRIPRLHYYYTHVYYTDRHLPGLGHIATNHSCWDLELIRLPIETQLLIYADFRVKDTTGPDGRRRMELSSLKEAFTTILKMLENVDEAKYRRYKAVYRKLRDLEDYCMALGVALDPPGFQVTEREKPNLPKGLDIVGIMAGKERPDLVAMATGPQLRSTLQFFAAAHNIGVMEQLRDLPALRRFLEEARSIKGWRDLRTYTGIVGDYAPAFSQDQKALALDFFRELLAHRDDDIRYEAACRMADILALGEDEWRKDLPDGVVVEGGNWVLRQVDQVLDLLNLAPTEAEEDMAPAEQVCYAVPVFLRRFFRRAEPSLAATVRARMIERLLARVGDHRPLVGLYTCEAFEILIEDLQPGELRLLPELAQFWAYHEVTNVRLMAWRLLRGLAEAGRKDPELMEDVRYCVKLMANQPRRSQTVADLFLLEKLAGLTGLELVAERSHEGREKNRFPIREVMLRNLKSQVGWVEKKVNCDYLVDCVLMRHGEGLDPESHFANEIAFHLANLLKVSRVEGTRFHAGRCLMTLLPILTDTQRNDLAIELLRSLQLDVESITRYIPRFLAPVLAGLPDQELEEILHDMEVDVRRGSEDLQRLLLQVAAWLALEIPEVRLVKGVHRPLMGVLLGSLADTRPSTVLEGFANVAMLLERLLHGGGREPRLKLFMELVAKKILSLVTHQAGERRRFFLIAQVLSLMDRAVIQARPMIRFPEKPRVGLLPGTFDPFTVAHREVVSRALAYCDEVLVQVDDYSWRKHAQPRNVRLELTWMALSGLPDTYLSPVDPPVNIANPESLQTLQRKLGHRKLHLIVGTDVLEGASAYRDRLHPVFEVAHLVTTREEHTSRKWQEKLGWFQSGVQVFKVPSQMKTISSTYLRGAFDRREDLELFCDPLIARTLRERQLYFNYPARKEEVFHSRWVVQYFQKNPQMPASLKSLVSLGAIRSATRWNHKHGEMAVLSLRENGQELAAIAWQEATAAAIPVVLEDEGLAEYTGQRLVGAGALVESMGVIPEDTHLEELDRLLSTVTGYWFAQGLLFAVFAVPAEGGEALWEVLRQNGAGWLPGREDSNRGLRWAALQMTEPLAVVHDLEQLLQPQFMLDPRIQEVQNQIRGRLSRFFADRHPGRCLLHIFEKETKRELVEMVRTRLNEAEAGSSWVVLGLGQQFSRDLIGSCPTMAIYLERFLTWQGYEAGMNTSYGSPSLEMQLTTARELGKDALLLVPFLDQPDAVLQIFWACKTVGIRLREVLIGTLNASSHAALHLANVPHRCGYVVPHWRGVLRESALIPFLGGWSIEGRQPLAGSLVPSLNDCLPYHDPHPLGLDRESVLDFSRLALEQAQLLFQALEDVFRASEGRLMSVLDLRAVARFPRCPPFPKSFLPPRDCAPSDFIAEDLQALARLHPESHHAHKAEWRK